MSSDMQSLMTKVRTKATTAGALVFVPGLALLVGPSLHDPSLPGLSWLVALVLGGIVAAVAVWMLGRMSATAEAQKRAPVLVRCAIPLADKAQLATRKGNWHYQGNAAGSGGNAAPGGEH